MRAIAIFGGTFDPIHEGHLQTSIELQNFFSFEHYFFLPCKVSPLKSSTIASEQQREDMIQLAIKNHQHFQLDKRELLREGPSYMVDTLKSFRQDYPNDSLNLILGNDAFNTLPHWYQWEKLITLANLIVIYRDTSPFFKEPALQDFIKHYQTEKPKQLLTSQVGQLFFFHAGHFAISSTHIRECIQNKKEVFEFLASDVNDYIKKNKLYQPS